MKTKKTSNLSVCSLHALAIATVFSAALSSSVATPAVFHNGASNPTTNGWTASTASAYGSAITNDNDTGIDAWRVNDSGASSLYYYKSLTAEQFTEATAIGWTLSVTLRVTDTGNAANGTRYVDFEDPANNARWGLDFGSDAEGKLTVKLRGQTTATTIGSGYQTLSLVYDATSKTATLYSGTSVVTTGYTGDSATISESKGIRWGSTSGSGTGAANYASITFTTGTIPEPSTWALLVGIVFISIGFLRILRKNRG